MVREVGFEPTNPYGTGASGLRVQDPYSRRGLFDLAWQHEPPISKGGLPQTPGPLPQEQRPRQGPNWLSPINQFHQNRAMFNRTPPGNPTQTPTYPTIQ